MGQLVLDIETNMDQSTIWCCVTMDRSTQEVKVWTTKENLNEYISNYSTIVGHNIVSFDAPILNRLWGTKIKLSQCKDTLLLSRLVNSAIEGGHSLKSWGIRLGDYKGDFTDFDGGLCDEMVEYCIQDVKLTSKVYDHLMTGIANAKISEQAIDIEHKVQAIIAQQERNGFKLNAEYAVTLLAELKDKMSAIEDNLQQIFPPIISERYSEKTGKRLKDSVEVFNVGSRQQIAKRLIEKGWKPSKFTENGQAVVDEEILDKLDIPEAKSIAEYLLLQKRASQLESWLEHLGDDGRVHGKVITFGAVTARATHHSPNMAQIPSVRKPYGREFRDCWTVDKGNVLVGCDLSGIELRCFAHYLNDPDYTNEVVNGDVHTRNQHAFGVETRDMAKTVLYATLYGASPSKIASTIGVPAQRGKEIIDNFVKSVPAYGALKSKVERVAAKGSLPGLAGYRLQVRSPHAALNTLLQSAGAIISKQWLIQIKENLTKAKIPYKQVAFVHDEVQIETAEKYGDIVGKLMVKAAKETGEILNFRCPVAAEYKVGHTWADCH